MTIASSDQVSGAQRQCALSLDRYKKLLGDDRHRMLLHDAFVGEIKALQGLLGEEQFPIRSVHNLSVEDYLARAERYEALVEPLTPIMAAGGYWGGDEHARLMGRCLARLADPPGDRNGNTGLLNLGLYPALLIAYACGIGAVLAGRYDTLATILVSTRIRKDNEQAPLVRALAHNEVIGGDLLQHRPELERHRTPTSDHLFGILKVSLDSIFLDEMEYQMAFDRFEYLYALIHGDVGERVGTLGRIWGPIGCFLWRRGILEEVEREIAERGDDWPSVKAGLFGGSVERAKQVKVQIDGIVHRQAC